MGTSILIVGSEREIKKKNMKLRKINILLQPTYLQAARDLNSLQSRGITAVVNCTTNISCYHQGTLGSTVGPVKL